MTIQDPLDLAFNELKEFAKTFSIEGANTTIINTSDLNMKFIKIVNNYDVSCMLNAYFSPIIRNDLVTTDSDGNEFMPSEFRINVSLQNIFTYDLKLANESLLFQLQVVNIAKKIQEVYQDKKVLCLWSTPESRLEFLNIENKNHIYQLCIQHFKGMKNNSVKRIVNNTPFLGTATYTFNHNNNKVYEVSVQSSFVFIKRIE